MTLAGDDLPIPMGRLAGWPLERLLARFPEAAELLLLAQHRRIW